MGLIDFALYNVALEVDGGVTLFGVGSVVSALGVGGVNVALGMFEMKLEIEGNSPSSYIYLRENLS